MSEKWRITSHPHLTPRWLGSLQSSRTRCQRLHIAWSWWLSKVQNIHQHKPLWLVIMLGIILNAHWYIFVFSFGSIILSINCNSTSTVSYGKVRCNLILSSCDFPNTIFFSFFSFTSFTSWSIEENDEKVTNYTLNSTSNKQQAFLQQQLQLILFCHINFKTCSASRRGVEAKAKAARPGSCQAALLSLPFFLPLSSLSLWLSDPPAPWTFQWMQNICSSLVLWSCWYLTFSAWSCLKITESRIESKSPDNPRWNWWHSVLVCKLN